MKRLASKDASLELAVGDRRIARSVNQRLLDVPVPGLNGASAEFP